MGYVRMNMYHSLTLIAFLSVSAPLASAQILNGSFEDGAGFFDASLSTELGTFAVDNLATASSWLFGVNAGLAVGGPAPDGDSAAWLSVGFGGNVGPFVSQSFFLGNTGSLTLGWDSFAREEQFSTQFGTLYRYNVDLSVAGGVSLFNDDFEENRFDGLATSHSVLLNATSGFYTLTFTGLDLPEGVFGLPGDTFIDNVTVAPESVTVVPEPGSALLAVLAGFGLVLHRRRRCLNVHLKTNP